MAKRGANIQRRMFQRITAGPETRVECQDHFLSSWRIRTDKFLARYETITSVDKEWCDTRDQAVFMTIYIRNSEDRRCSGESITGAQFQFG